MAGRNEQGGGRLPPIHVPDPSKPNEAYVVDRVTPENRTALHKGSQEMQVALYEADLSSLIGIVYIPRTREMPDCISYFGILYVFHDTETKPPQYVRAMVANATQHPKEKGNDNGTS